METDKTEQKRLLQRILREEFGIFTEKELDAVIAAQPRINLAPFCAPVGHGASAGQSTDSHTDYPAEGHKENPRKIRL